jgi:hypothetical protein
MAAIYEYDSSIPLEPGDVDGMEQFVIDDVPLETDWDIAFENPPHAHWDGPDLQQIGVDDEEQNHSDEQ